MGALRQLLGVANNLADSFVSVTNLQFLKHIESLPVEKTKLLEIDVLQETITPEEVMSKTVMKTITKYKKWFFSEMNNANICAKDIEKVLVKLTYKSGKSFSNYYTCTATIQAKGKKYTKKVLSSFS